VKAGKLRPLASWGPKRHEGYPEVPTFRELGYDVEYLIWAGMFVPKATPEPVVKVLRDAARRAVEDPDFKGMMAKVNSPVNYLDAPEFARFWMADARRLADAVKVVGKVEDKK
jgi:tripartite-type tricarboxylate transporter receptor subunit TctC